MDLILLMFKLSFILFIIPIALFGFLQRFNPKGRYNFLFSLGLSPGIISWIYMLLLRLLPHQSSFFYLLITTVPFVPFLFKKNVLESFFKEFYVFKDIFKEKINLIIISILLLIIIFFYLFEPLNANDPLEYFFLSHLIDTKKDLGFYPSVSGIEPRGFIAPFTHPVGYASLLAWGRLSSSGNFGVFTAEFLSFLFTFFTIFTISFIQIREKIKPFLVASIIFLTTPFVYTLTLDAHIDGARMLYFLLATLALYDHFKNQSSIFLVGIACGFSWFFHSSGILTLIMMLGTYVCFYLLKERKVSLSGIKNLFSGCILVTFSCFLFIFVDLIKIYSVYGKLIGDLENIPIINFFAAEFKHYLELSRHINSLGERLKTLYNQTFFNFWLFGISYWLAFVGIIINFKIFTRNLKNNQWNYEDFSFVIVILFYTFVVLVTIVEINTFAMNPRYILQIQPLIALLGIITFKRIFTLKSFFIKLTVVAILATPLLPRVLDIHFSENLLANQKLQTPSLKLLNSLKGRALVMRQGEILNYSGLNILHIYDKRFFDGMTTSNKFKGIDYIVLNYYNDPVMYSSFLKDVLYNSSKSSLIFDLGGWQIFQLHSTKSQNKAIDVSFKMALSENKNKEYIYLSHKNEYPSLDILPQIKNNDFPSLKPGLYDVLCEIDAEVPYNTKMNLKVKYKGCPLAPSPKTVFYLKPGRQQLLTRFLASHTPFRLVIVSANPNITFHNVKVSFRLYKKLLSPNNILYTQENFPVSLEDDGKTHLKINSEEYRLHFEKPFQKGESLHFKVNGYGKIVLSRLPLNLKIFIENIVNLFPVAMQKRTLLILMNVCSLFFEEYSYAIDNREQKIDIKFNSPTAAEITFVKSPTKKEQIFILHPFSIKRGN